MLIKAELVGFEGENAVLKTDDGAKFLWPKSKLPKNTSINSHLRIAVSNEDDVVNADSELAKDILNEILNTSQEEKI